MQHGLVRVRIRATCCQRLYDSLGRINSQFSQKEECSL